MQSEYADDFDSIIKYLDQGSFVWGYDNRQKFAHELDEKVYMVIIKARLGELGKSFIEMVNSNLYQSFIGVNFQYWKLWNLAVKVDQFINSNASEKNRFLDEVCATLNSYKSDYSSQMHVIMDRNYIKKVYTSGCVELINLFKENLPIPPIEIFDVDNIPEFLVERREENAKKFEDHNTDSLFEKKVMCIQRHVRSKLRYNSELERISSLYFKNESDPELRKKAAVAAIREANTLYRPQKCSVELADTIMKSAKEIQLYSSVNHLTAADNIASILDGCLFGRKNLINGYIDFRPAALGEGDVTHGDLNVICMGPDIIDDKCLYGRTVGLEFNLGSIIENPNIFFKQKDLGYQPGTLLSIQIQNETFYFSHLKDSWPKNQKQVNFQLFKDPSKPYDYISNLPAYTFISYNLPKIHQILTLNFFRFLDSLDGWRASEMIAYIYEKISQLDENQLRSFLTEVGQKMSCTSEFNISGAYKIDLEALKNLIIYHEKEKICTIEIELLKKGNKVEFEKLEKYLPEILNSKRFVEYLNRSNVL